MVADTPVGGATESLLWCTSWKLGVGVSGGVAGKGDIRVGSV